MPLAGRGNIRVSSHLSFMYNFIIRKCISNDLILKCLEDYFRHENIPVRAFDADKNQRDNVLFDSTSIKGDFCVQLWLYTVMIFNVKILAVHICNFLKTEVLISDESANPFSWILITEEGEERVVYQRTDDTDADLFLLKNS